MNKKLIQNQLEKLNQLLDQIEEVRIIQPDEPDTWDCDLLANLVKNCQSVIKLCEDKRSKQLDSWEDPLVLEEGLYSLINSYQENDEEEEDYD